MDRFAEEYKDHYVFIYIDVDNDDLDEIKEVYELTDLPHFVILDGPGPAESRRKSKEVEEIEQFIKTNIAE